MVVKDGRAKIAPVRDGTTPCIKPSEFDEDTPGLFGCTLQNDMVELFGDEGPLGLGGCPRPTHDTYPALAWYDMLDDEPNTQGTHK